MTKPPGTAILLVAASITAALAAGVALRDRGDGARCGSDFEAKGARCIARRPGASCAPPLIATVSGCDAPDIRILIPDTTLVVGSADWEAEGEVRSRTVHVPAFRLAAFEATRGAAGQGQASDAARALTGLSRDEAAAFCAQRGGGGRLPTEDEWIAAATAGHSSPRRYPWGDTGAVCRRAAWGLLTGPCALGADGPDTVGAHPDGDSPLGIHDLAGNAAEWVDATATQTPPAERRTLGIAKGGSWQSALASDLRVWARMELDPDAHDSRVGVRCAYPP